MSGTFTPPQMRVIATIWARRRSGRGACDSKGVPLTLMRAIAPLKAAPLDRASMSTSAISSSVCSGPTGSTRCASLRSESRTAAA